MDFVARQYDPSLGRFVQADTIVPLATQGIQALDRYAFVNNNSVKYSDPTGYCTGDPDDTSNTDAACWERYFRIVDKYGGPGGFVTLDTSFTIKELDYILRALDFAARAFGGVAKFGTYTGWFHIKRGGEVGAPSGILKTVTLYGSDFSYQKSYDIVFSILHEVGHIFDFNRAGFNSTKYKSAEFVAKLNQVSCKPGPLGCMGDDPGFYGSVNSLLGGGAFGEWNPNPRPYRSYGLRSSIEDFADSFAIYVLNANLVRVFQISTERISILSQYFSLPY